MPRYKHSCSVGKACLWVLPLQVLNNRFQVLQEMLDMLRDHQNNFHTAR